MERRDFLAAFAATAATVAAKPFDAVSPPPVPAELEPLPAPTDMDEYLARVDAGLARIATWSPTAGASSFTGDRAATDALAQRSVQALFLTGMLGDLPIPSQMHPGMQDRVWKAMPMFDEAANGMTSLLTSQTEADLARVQTALKSANVRDRLVNSLDAEASKNGVSTARRAQLHDLLQHVTWRMAEQPPSLIVNEYLEKVEKVSDTDVGSEARQRQLAARVGEEAFWTMGSGSVRDQRISRGAKTMGIGFITFALGGAAVAAGAFPGVFAMTVGVIVMLVGLIILLVGLATSEPPPPVASTPPSSP